MTDGIRMRIRLQDDIADVKMLVFHPMETGYRKNKATGEIVPKHFIKTLQAMHNGETVLEVQWSRSVSRNPFLHFRLRNARKGDTVSVAWQDNFGETGAGEDTIR